ncbi:uncharacterized protein LOC131845358 [Achroia grisella]|uniref:uncharacterized protein LOC131845358 n=1 Tax=Achroia grisella TaxID=688607 RepID=UPI0027D33BF7|nr:uncharacterized protein LOC131845358 [Achroia grisella]
MSYGQEEGPVYYREIQKNAYLKRVPNETSGSKLRPLGHKKVPLKAMWTLFCVHNGRTPFLEQYPEPESPATLAHKPVWRACLRTARHVTASVKPRAGVEYDFLIDTEHGPVRMIAPDWDAMQDWVTTLRNKLHELKILSKGENVYCAAPAAPVPRAAARDPTSPLPPTPPVPPDRVPGIELVPSIRPPPEEPPPTPPPPQPDPVDISNWDENPQPSTSQETQQPRSVTKICGQNICLDDSILKRITVTDSDEEFFAEVDRIHASADDEYGDDNSESFGDQFEGFKQTLVVGDDVPAQSSGAENVTSDHQATNITVIQVSNKPPHTAIPVLGPETNIFNFNFDQKLTIQPDQPFINIVNTEVNVTTPENSYGTVYKDNEYGHLSLTTTVNLTDAVKLTDAVSATEGVYERLCMASTSTENPVNKVINIDKVRKSSLPNLDAESTYEYLFPSNNNRTNIQLRVEEITSNPIDTTGNVNDQLNPDSGSNSNSNGINNCNSNINGINRDNSNATEGSTREFNRSGRELEVENRPRNVHVSVSNTAPTENESTVRILRSNVERSYSQSAYDTSDRMRQHLIRRAQNSSPKRDNKNDKSEVNQPKPIWKRGLTELSLLTRLRGIGNGKRHESPTRHEVERNESQHGVTAPGPVVRRSRPEARVDTARRRSSSLNNGAAPSLATLRSRQAAALRADLRRGAALPAAAAARDPPVFADYDARVWVARWGGGGWRAGGRAGDRVAAVRGTAPRDAAHARMLFRAEPSHQVDMLFYRVPLGIIYVLNRRENESLGIKLDGECCIVSVERASAAGRAGVPPAGRWAVTEVNNRPLTLLKGGEEEMHRLSMHGSEISVLIQPAALVKKLRAAIKANKNLMSMR